MAGRCCQPQTPAAAESCFVQAHTREIKNKEGAGERGQEDAVSSSAGAVPPLEPHGPCSVRAEPKRELWHPSAWLGVTVALTGTLQPLGAVINEHPSICSSLWNEPWNSWSHEEEQEQ